MTSNDFSDFVVPAEESSLPDGEYVAQVDSMRCVVSDYGKFYTVTWKVMRPSGFEGGVHQERYNINHGNDLVRRIAVQNFGKFCREIGGLSEGAVPDEKNFLFKVANILIRNKVGKDGRVFANVVRHTLADQALVAASSPVNKAYDDAMSQYGAIAVPQNASASNVELNDEVPF